MVHLNTAKTQDSGQLARLLVQAGSSGGGPQIRPNFESELFSCGKMISDKVELILIVHEGFCKINEKSNIGFIL